MHSLACHAKKELFDFQVKDGVLRYIFRLGDRMKILKVPGYNITDGKFHDVTVQREGNTASVQIDYGAKVEGTTGGIHKLLNMGGGSFFSGGMPNLTEVRIVDAWVRSGGNAILRGADGSVVASGLGAGSAGTLSGASFFGTMIQLGAFGQVHTSSYSTSEHVSLSGVVAVSSSYSISSSSSSSVTIIRGSSSAGSALGTTGKWVRNVRIVTGSSAAGGGASGGGTVVGGSAGGGAAGGGGTGAGAAGGGAGGAGGSASGTDAGGGGLSVGVGGSGAYGGSQGVRAYGEGIPMVGTATGASADGGSETMHVFGDFAGESAAMAGYNQIILGAQCS